MNLFLAAYDALYTGVLRPSLFRESAGAAHERVIALLRAGDDRAWLTPVIRAVNRASFPDQPTLVGGVVLPHPIMLAAGFVKGDGFADENAALAAVDAGHNIIPGWHMMPSLVGAVEFGSFTRHPRMGNIGVVVWRDAATQSTQNRIGLRNPGARAAAAFLAAQPNALPAVYGINIAVTPNVDDPDRDADEITQAAGFFVAAAVRPSWVTLNLSCPNTDDDPRGNQSEAKARRLCAVLIGAVEVPVWVKISPGLSDAQLESLMRAFADCGVRAVIATNTRGEPTPDGASSAGVGGGRLYADALDTVRRVSAIKRAHGYAVDVIACGGILKGAHIRAYREAGADAFQIWSALVYRGVLAAALILGEAQNLSDPPPSFSRVGMGKDGDIRRGIIVNSPLGLVGQAGHTFDQAFSLLLAGRTPTARLVIRSCNP